jgi:hypothetical protein
VCEASGARASGVEEERSVKKKEVKKEVQNKQRVS